MVMRIVITPEAVDYVRRHSGVAYIWASESGFLHADIQPPNADAEWDEHGAEGVTVRIASSAPDAVEWRISFRRFPRAHLIAGWNGTPSGIQDVYGSGIW